MEKYPEYVQFNGKWRKYQQKVIKELDIHLKDKHLHVIAPPGSGKTILGLEIARIINKPTVIFAPSIAIRNQWIEKLNVHFLPKNLKVDWISVDIFNPQFLIVITYQSLHSGLDIKNTKNKTPNGQNNVNQNLIIDKLKQLNVQTIIIDEAHHIKNEWWKSVANIKSMLDPFVVALTATPPYDATALEWHKYINLNGAVDIEISVPELISEGDLCPHQDYIYFSLPDDVESKSLLSYREKTRLYFNEITQDEELKSAILAHPILSEPEIHLDWIYDNLETYLSCLIFANYFGKIDNKIHHEILGKKLSIPKLDLSWLEILLNYYAIHGREQFVYFDDHIESMLLSLKRAGFVHKNKISFGPTESEDHKIKFSISKLKAINTIVDFEYGILGRNARILILTDFIRKEYISNDETNNFALTRLGAIPIFESLRRNNSTITYGVLTGSVVIIPSSAEVSMVKVADSLGVSGLVFTQLRYDANYSLVTINDTLGQQITQIMTALFECGDINVFIGTKSLLGEGWDAPFINVMVLASFVGSFVTSNQMRGRAIRTYTDMPNKTSNIWHLICVDRSSLDGGSDFVTAKRKFKNFVGLSLDQELKIENGIQRVLNVDDIFTDYGVEKANIEAFAKASKRELLSESWMEAIQKGTVIRDELKIKYLHEIPYQKNNESKKIKLKQKGISTLTLAGLQASIYMFGTSYLATTWPEMYFIFNLFSVLGLGIFGTQTLVYLKSYINHRDISKDIANIADALLATLLKGGFLISEKEELSVIVSQDEDGNIYCHLECSESKDKEVFTKCLEEILNPVDNPKYVIIRKSKWENLIDQNDYHPVPDIIGKKKNLVEHYYEFWKRYVGSAQLVNTRTIEGRKFLLKARSWTLMHAQIQKTEHTIKWQ